MLDRLFSFKRKDVPAPAEARPAVTGAPVRRERSLQRVLVAVRDLPAGYELISAEGGELPLSAAQRQQYAVVRIARDDRQAMMILVSEELRADRSMGDAVRLGIRDQLKRREDIRVDWVYAYPEMIRELYQAAGPASGTEDSALIQAVDDMLLGALQDGISDLHLEVRRNTAVLRARMHGELVERQAFPVAHATALARVIYGVLAMEKEVAFAETRAQSGVAERTLGGQLVRVRIQTSPVNAGGFDMVMRLLASRESIEQDLSALGYSAGQITTLEEALARPVGVIVFSGTTGSGKTTSLASLLSAEARASRGTKKIITVEDPPEVAIPGTTQIPVVRGRKMDEDDDSEFAFAIKAAMRMDPDVLMVGEVRDNKSASLLVQAVQSGHRAMTTLHAPSAFGIVGRLRNIGVGSDVLGAYDFLSGLVYQALLRVLCSHCSLPWSEHQALLDEALNERLRSCFSGQALARARLRNPDGCGHCRQGVAGRTVVAEVVVPDEQMKRLIAQGDDTGALEHHRERGGTFILDHGVEKMLAGICDPRDVEDRLGRITPAGVRIKGMS